MTLPQEPSTDSASNSDDVSLAERTFEQELTDIERSLLELKERYSQVQRDEQLQAQLQERQAQVKQALQQTRLTTLKVELKQIQEKLDELEVNLESRLFSWGSLREPFWQVIRFGGVGVVIGWLLAFAVLQQPKPVPSAPATNPASQVPRP